MRASFSLSRDQITPSLQAILERLKNKARIHTAMGMVIVSLAKRAWTDPTLRPIAWVAKKEGRRQRCG